MARLELSATVTAGAGGIEYHGALAQAVPQGPDTFYRALLTERGNKIELQAVVSGHVVFSCSVTVESHARAVEFLQELGQYDGWRVVD